VDHVHWTSRPTLRSPVLVAAFTGWNDAGDAASMALRQLADAWEAEPFAEIDPDEFVDYQSTRPRVRLTEDDRREVEWPATELLSAAAPGTDVVLVTGPEPQLRWRSYCSQIVGVARELDVKMVVTLGALLADVPHRRPVSVIGTGADPALVQRFGLQRSRYEGPTGIVGCLNDSCNRAGVASLSLWAAVPAYAPATVSPKAALALVQRAAALVGASVDASPLEVAVAEYEAEVDRFIERDEDLQSYVEQLEEMAGEDDDDLPEETHPAESGSAERLVAEVEQFLRDQD
jgi:proteasome assembly chaperone (PAC2) family protein